MGIAERVSIYKELSKSGIVALVCISVFGGYLIGQPAGVPLDLSRLAETLFGILFLASGSSALNQLQEIQKDSEMPRTAKRPLPSGRMSRAHATVFILLALAAGLILLKRVDTQLLYTGAAAVLFYNGLYTMWWKRHWAFAAVPGAIPGALPVLMGFAAANGSLWAPGGIYLFGILFFWQMPHFWVLALRFQDDYRKGGFPTLPVAHGSGITVYHIVLWCLAYVGLAFLAPLFFPVRWIYLIPTVLVSAKLLWELRGFVHAPEGRKWLHFFLWVNFSLIVYIGAAALDLWSFHLFAPWIAR